MTEKCNNCGAVAVGKYCHNCRRIALRGFGIGCAVSLLLVQIPVWIYVFTKLL